MLKENIAVIISIEIAAILLVVCFLLLYKIRSLRELVKKLQSRMMELVNKIKNMHLLSKNDAQEKDERTYIFHVNEELLKTRKYHAQLNSERDITLDISPDTELPKRAAALRHAVLLAEKEAIHNTEQGEESPDWLSIGKRYQQIFSFYEDYATQEDKAPQLEENTEQIEVLNQELENAKKRIDNLSRFQTMYFDLEAQWNASKDQADSYYNNISNMIASIDGGAEIEEALKNYRNVYNDFETIIHRDIDGPASGTTTIVERIEVRDEQTVNELRQLREVTAGQHQTIEELQAKLVAADSQEERTQIITSLQDELEKQKRFMQEADTCIQLMEDELNNAQIEVDALHRRLEQLPAVQNEIATLEKQNDIFRRKIESISAENEQLVLQLEQQNVNTTISSNEDTSKIKQELQELETRYANLEEKFLDLKMSQ